MEIVFALVIVLGTIIAMECLSWCIHKYLFHGPLWFLHKSHHEKSTGFLEWNDLFAILFASLSLYLMYIDRTNFGYKFFIGVGITIYGLIYFVVHDWFVHRRFKTFKSKNFYLTAVRKAHKIHHKNMGKEHGKAFGLLFFTKGILSDTK
ncbi:fatty acid hydroxylase [Pedobacter changchengzhani]|uniref:Fatty acid hydroxylase n=1 Tax=Pedobacter changchengzhani TaxID=2529274 RepID=A0A4R5MH88_9SPHI|nr:sterol desaturase family protein [Pedobacter changchengzhani]TDG34878.1 fatty acid hydroxylase [Pedobacter changchengzhani]